jgi:hypothetical protein
MVLEQELGIAVWRAEEGRGAAILKQHQELTKVYDKYKWAGFHEFKYKYKLHSFNIPNMPKYLPFGIMEARRKDG